MKINNRSYFSLTINDLKKLKKLALKEHEEFFKRNPHLKSAYYNSLIGICLCQGAASHYLNPSVGIKDFDIWFFYVKDDSIYFQCRKPKRNKNAYKEKPIDFLKRIIPKYICNFNPNDPEKTIMEYLKVKNTKTKIELLKKAIIGLYPDKIFGKEFWKGNL
ncbi:hypothetical protein ES703_60230 [subsurface metagenome]